jgi:hypothetical protein
MGSTSNGHVNLNDGRQGQGQVDVHWGDGPARRPSGSRPMVKRWSRSTMGSTSNGHVNLNDGHQGQGPGPRQPGDASETGSNPSVRDLLSRVAGAGRERPALAQRGEAPGARLSAAALAAVL